MLDKDLRELTTMLMGFYLADRKTQESKENVPVGISGRHVHLSEKDLEVLFGKGYSLTPIKELSQPGQFAAKETVTICGYKGTIEKVRIIGPLRKTTQIEVLQGDSFKLGVEAPVRMSGDLDGSPGITLIGPKGVVTTDKGLIIAARHIHMSPNEAKSYGLTNGQVVSVESEGPRGGILKNVIVRADANGALDFHIDMEEANGLGIKNGDLCKILK